MKSSIYVGRGRSCTRISLKYPRKFEIPRFILAVYARVVARRSLNDRRLYKYIEYPKWSYVVVTADRPYWVRIHRSTYTRISNAFPRRRVRKKKSRISKAIYHRRAYVFPLCRAHRDFIVGYYTPPLSLFVISRAPFNGSGVTYRE